MINFVSCDKSSIYDARFCQILGSMLIAAGGYGGSGNLAQTEEILTGSLLPSLPRPVKNNALVVATDPDGKNKVCYVLSLIWLNNRTIHLQALVKF